MPSEAPSLGGESVKKRKRLSRVAYVQTSNLKERKRVTMDEYPNCCSFLYDKQKVYEHKDREVQKQKQEAFLMRPRGQNATKVTKDSRIIIRVSQADKERYEAEAKHFGMSTSKYILYSVDNKVINVVEGGAEIVRAMYELNCALSKNEAREDISTDELRRALTTCVDKLNRFCENLQEV